MNTILITGATDGIGLALARHYHSQGNTLLLIGRRPLGEFKDPLFTPAAYCQSDLSQPDCADTIARFLDEQQIDRLDLLIHNAGLGYVGPTEAQSPESIEALTAVNLLAPMRLTHRLLPRVHRAQGKIVFISSVMSTLPCPDYAVYGATKAALDAFVRNLRLELDDSVVVQVIHPGATRSGMQVKSGLQVDAAALEKFSSAEETAAQIARAIKRNRPSAAIGLGNSLARFAGKYFAGPLDWVLRRNYR